MKYLSRSIDETAQIARELVAAIKAGEAATVVALVGDLGSGKTTFSQCVGEALGVRDPIQSPTFLIEKIYELHQKLWKHLVHIDAYRLEKDRELISLGWEDIISKKENLILVEWADKVAKILPESTIFIKFTFIDEVTREIEVYAK